MKLKRCTGSCRDLLSSGQKPSAELRKKKGALNKGQSQAETLGGDEGGKKIDEPGER